MIAWYGEQKLKDAALSRMREHRRLDQLIQGEYFNNAGHGCHLGCLTHRNEDSHEATERMFGIELRVAYWLERVFEFLSEDQCGDWVIDSLEAIPVGADLSKCHHHLAVYLLGPDSPSAEGNGHKLVRESIAATRQLHARAINGGLNSRSAARSAASAARSAADSAAWSAASAARSAAWSADSAAWSARSAADSAARSAAWSKIAAESIRIFANAPIVTDPTAEELCVECVSNSIRELELLKPNNTTN